MEMLVPDVELKKRIDEFIQSKMRERSQSTSSDMEL